MDDVRFPRSETIATTLGRRWGHVGCCAAGAAWLLLASGCGFSIPSSGGTGLAMSGVPVVRLTVSNPSPQVNDEVILRCEIIDGGSVGEIFAFQPDNGRLLVNRATGTASFIVDGSDIGVSFSFTCSATDESGTSELSNEQVILPT